MIYLRGKRLKNIAEPVSLDSFLRLIRTSLKNYES
jgi:hypothetical protein